MFRGTLLALMFSLGICPALCAQDWATRMFQTTTHDFGHVAWRAKAEFAFRFTNPYAQDVEVARTRVSCKCTSVTVEKAVVKPGEQGAIVASLNSGSYMGQKGSTITVTFIRPAFAEVQLHVTSYIDRAVVLEPGSVDFGIVPQGADAERTVTVRNEQQPNWKILDVKSDNPHLSGAAVETSRGADGVAYEVRVRLDRAAPPGYFKAQLLLATGDGQSAEVPLMVEGQVTSSVTVSPTELFLGQVRPGQQVVRQIVVRAARPMRITSVTGGEGCRFAAPTAQAAKTLHLIGVTFTAPKAPGKIDQTIRIETDFGNPPLAVPLHAEVTP